jgi:uncharacterized transporter YbjL
MLFFISITQFTVLIILIVVVAAASLLILHFIMDFSSRFAFATNSGGVAATAMLCSDIFLPHSTFNIPQNIMCALCWSNSSSDGSTTTL